MWLWLCVTVLAGMGASGPELKVAPGSSPRGVTAIGQGAEVAAFQFGTPTSAARVGFTKVTTEAASPGILTRMDVVDPPYMAP